MYTLFIADDEQEQVEGIKKIIDWKSHNISICGEANTGTAAFEDIKSLKPDIVLLDIRMPHMNGLEMLEKLKPLNYHTKFIILSGYDDFTYAQKALRYKAVDYLLKPSRPSDILEAALKAIDAIETERRSYFISDKKADQESVCPVDIKNVSPVIRKAIEFINLNYSKDITLQTVADEVYITSGYLSLIFKQETGVNFIDYLNKYRIQMAKELLRNVKFKNYEVASQVGYKDEKYFSQMFKKFTSKTPSEYRSSL